MAFIRSRRVYLRHTDAAGILYFAEQLTLVHEVYEELLSEAGLGIGRLLVDGAFALPIVRAETELLAPLFVDDELHIELFLEQSGSTSFTLEHRIYKAGDLVGKGRTVHVCVDAPTKRPRELPPELARAFARLATAQDSASS